MDKKNIQDILSLTPTQEGMLYHYLKKPQHNLYFAQLCLEISGQLDIQCFTAAWNFVVKTNEMLHTSFRWEQVKAPLQIILKESSIELHYYDFSDKANSEKINAWEEVKKQDGKRGFDLRNIPFRISLCKMDDGLFQVIISHHHILFDGWSNGIILKEFFEAYNELCNRKPLTRLKPAKKTRFKEFVKWIGTHEEDEVKKSEEAAFWKQYLGDFEGETAIPLKQERISNTEEPGENRDYNIELDPGISQALVQFTSSYNITPAVLFYSTWGLLLHKYCSSNDVIFGTTVSGRSAKIPGIENMVGLFINTLPLRIRFYPGETILDMLWNLNDSLQVREAYESTPLMKVSQNKRGSTIEEQFDSIVVVENYPLDIRRLQQTSPLTITSYSIMETAHYDLTLLIRLSGSINIHCLYQNRLFEEEAIRQLSSHFLRILHVILENPHRDIFKIDILSNREKQQILEEFNNTEADYPRDKNIRQLFAEQVEQTPDNIALVAPLKTKYRTHMTYMIYISYRQLNEISHRLAHLLQERGIGPDIIAAIMTERSLEMVIGILAILKAGGAYLPIDLEYPQERIDYMLKDSNAKILLAAPDLTSAIEPSLSTLTSTSTCQVSPANLAYIIYTSGSTGKPKGVMVEHGSVANLLWALQKQYPLTASDTYLLKTSYIFDVSVAELFGWFIGGGRLAVLESNGEKDPKIIIDTIERLGITHINFVPSMFNVFIEGLNSLDINKLSSLEYIFLAGEALLPGLVKKFRELNTTIPLENIYGPTEGTVYSSNYSLSRWDGRGNIPIGKPLQNMKLYILDKKHGLQPIEVPGELYIGGKGIARGYLNQPELTAERFRPPLNRSYRSYMSYILYKSGDLARWLSGGNIEFLGRIDNQVKIRGFRIELGEIENRLMNHQIIKEAVVVRENESLCAYIVCEPSAGKSPDKVSIREYLSQNLPDYMVPAHFLQLEEIPRTPSGKVDRKALLSTGTVMKTGRAYVSPKNDIEKIIADTWKDLLALSSVGIYDNFFDLGGNSLLLIRLASRLNQVLERKKEIPVITLFNHPTIASLARYLSRHEGENHVGLKKMPTLETNKKAVGGEIAIIGMACRFPGAKNCEEFWNNLKNGIETIGLFSVGELEEKGVDPGLVTDPNYVPVKGRLESNLCFDAFFFGYTPTEAAIMDPQVRIFHECTWEALENAGYNPGTYKGSIGLYAGASPNPFWEILPLRSVKGNNLYSYSELWDAVQFSDKDYLSTRVAYKLDLKGPVVTLQTACSTSLVAVDQACRGLLSGACDMALAGGVSITLHDESGYLYQEGTIMSPDGHCRAFDADANGTVGGNGVGIVVLKPLEKAMTDGDTIFAIIKGFGINNDGRNKAGFTAPSSEGQARAIRGALNIAGVSPESISYIETHGTGTLLGDPIEIQGLKMAWESFEPSSPGNFNKKKYCAIGSVKTNIGHLDAAAGIAGLIKTVLVLHHRSIPPSLYFKRPNPGIDFENSPFYVNTCLKPWENEKYPRRAGVSSFGLGGTNVHLILQEFSEGTRGLAPLPQTGGPVGQRVNGHHTDGRGGSPCPPLKSRKYHLILLSAKTESALDKMTQNLVEYFKNSLLNHGNHENPINPGQNPGINIADAAYTLQIGRKAFPHRRTLVCSLPGEAVRKMEAGETGTNRAKEEKSTVIFMFSGQGSQYIDMGLDLYKNEPVFHQQVDHCFQLLERITGRNMKPVLYPGLHTPPPGLHTPPPASPGHPSQEGNERAEAEKKIYEFLYTTPIKFIFEYSLAKLLMAWGIQPDAMIGHSFGEYVAACLSGVFSLEDAIYLAALRGELMHRLPPGAMLSVPLTGKELKPMLDRDDNLSLAAVNGESLCVVSGPVDTIDNLEKELNEKGHECIRFRVPKAGHSRMVEPIMKEFNQRVRKVVFKKPRIPYVSGMSGTWITAEEALDPGYWTRHLRETVRFADGLTTLFKEPNPLFLQVGPGRGLTLFVSQHPDKTPETLTINMVRHRKEEVSDVYYTLTQIGQLWRCGLSINWQAFHSRQKRQRIPLPVYPFESEYYPVDKDLFKLDAPVVSVVEKAPGVQKKEDIAEWFYVPSWERVMLPVTAAATNTTGKKREKSGMLIFMDRYGLGRQLKKHLEQEGIDVITVERGGSFRLENNGCHVTYTLNPYETNSYIDLLKELGKQDKMPRHVVHLWGIDPLNPQEPVKQQVDEALALGFYSLLFLVQALDKHGGEVSQGLRIEVVTSHVHEVTGEEELCPEKAAIYGLCTVIPQEYPHIFCRCIDILLPPSSDSAAKQGRQLMAELFSGAQDRITAYRGDYRWVQSFKPLRLENPGPGALALKPGAITVITGGTGAIGLVLARHLAETYKAKLILTCRSVFSAKEEWDQWLSTHPADDPISRKIGKLREMEAIGGEVIVMRADVSSLAQMKEVFTRAEEKWGAVDGVIHSAGIVGEKSYTELEEMGKAGAHLHFQPKIYGLLVLEELLKKRSVDFCLLMSSTSSILGGLGFGAYCAANVFMDTYINRLNRRGGTRWISINWDGWQLEEQQVQDTPLGSVITQLAMTPGQGVKVFERVLAYKGIKQVVQCTGDLQTRIRQWVELESLKKQLKDEGEPETAVPASQPLYQPRPHLSNPYVPPGNPLEQELAGIWKQLLGYDQVGTQDNFFELNGDSLKAVIAISKIHKQLNIKIPLKDFFAEPTIEGLARYLEQTKENVYLCIEPVEKREYYRLSGAQKRMWVLYLMEKTNTAYNIFQVMELKGKPQREWLAGIFQRLIKRHESLRTSFLALEPGPVQKIHDRVDFEMDFHGFHDFHDSTDLLKRFVCPFDLTRAPLLWVGLIKSGKEKHLLAVNIHHIISDGISMGILLREFIKLAEGESLPGLRIQYKDFLEWENRRLACGGLGAQEQFWLKEFETGAPVLDLPVDYPRPGKRSYEGNRYREFLGREEFLALKTIALEEGMTLSIVLLAVFSILLSKLSGQEDIVIGLTVFGRRHPDLDQVMGMFVNMLALRTYPGKPKPFRAFLQEVKEKTLQAFENQDYPFEKLVEKAALKRDSGRNPLFDAEFVLQPDLLAVGDPEKRQDRREFISGPVEIKPYDYYNPMSNFDIFLLAMEKPGGEGICLDLHYWTKLFKPRTIKMFLTYYIRIINQVSRDREINIRDITLIEETEKNKILQSLKADMTELNMDWEFKDL